MPDDMYYDELESKSRDENLCCPAHVRNLLPCEVCAEAHAHLSDDRVWSPARLAWIPAAEYRIICALRAVADEIETGRERFTPQQVLRLVANMLEVLLIDTPGGA
jgi:hypothetical protein